MALARPLIKHAVLIILETRKGLELIPAVTVYAKRLVNFSQPPWIAEHQLTQHEQSYSATAHRH